MNDQTRSQLNVHAALLARLAAEGLKLNDLKKKHRVGKAFHSHQHTCNHGGGVGRAANRMPGWKKHGKGPQNVPR